MTITPLLLLLLLLHKMLISQLQKTVGFGQMYAAFFSVHFSLSFALCFALLSPPPKICDFYFDKTEKKSKRTWSFLPEIREVEQKKIISLYKHENTLSFLHKNWRLILQSFWLFYLCLMILFNISWIWNNPTNIFIFVKFEGFFFKTEHFWRFFLFYNFWSS